MNLPYDNGLLGNVFVKADQSKSSPKVSGSVSQRGGCANHDFHPGYDTDCPLWIIAQHVPCGWNALQHVDHDIRVEKHSPFGTKFTLNDEAVFGLESRP